MKQLAVLHLASFSGNIGDNANHNGTYGLWEKHLSGYALTLTQLEIREFYWKQRTFDAAFAAYVNTFDLLVIGGGNYFEMWVESSPTGTSIAIPPDVFRAIKTPTLFYALGLDPYNGYSRNTVSRFKAFLDTVLDAENCLISLRNDGAIASAQRVLGEEYASRMHVVPDGGFFVQTNGTSFRNMFPHVEGPHIGLNLAGDMLEKRYGEHGPEDALAYFKELAGMFVRLVARHGVKLVTFPHIYKDISVLQKFFSCLPDRVLRTSVFMAPYLSGQGAEKIIFDIYANMSLNMGTRFHANVCSIGLGTPSIGMDTYPQIPELYREVCLGHRCVSARHPHDIDVLSGLVEESLRDPESVRRECREVHVRLEAEVAVFYAVCRDWMGRQQWKS